MRSTSFRVHSTVVFVCCILWGIGVTRAQNDPIDSMKRVLTQTKSDTVRINTMLAITEMCELKDILPYASESAALCEKAVKSGTEPKKFYLRKLATSLNNIGYYYGKIADRAKSLDYYKRALAIDEKLGDKQEYAMQLGNIAATLFSQGNLQQAIEYNFKCLKIQEELKDTLGMAYSLNGIGYGYTNMRDFPKAIEYNNKSYKLSEAVGDKRGMAQTQHNMGLTYNYMRDFPKSLECYNKALAIFTEINNDYGICASLSGIGGAYVDMNENTKALEFLKRALVLAEKDNLKVIQTQTLFLMSEALIDERRENEALPYAKKAYQLATEMQSPRELEVSARTLKSIYEKQHKYKEAFEMQKLEITMRDSVVNEEDRKKTMQQEMQYQYEKKELQAKLDREKELSAIRIENERKLARRNTIVYILISLAVILGISIFYIYKFFRQRTIINANRNNELRQKLLRSQMNPHFIFNSVDNIQSLILNRQDKEAVNYLAKFSKLTRQILEYSAEDYITLDEELNMIENYLSIQQLLYNNNFTFEVETDAGIDRERVLVPPMLTQPFVENAIKHGLKNKKAGGLVQVRFYMKEQSLYFEVSDNGSGLEEKTLAGHKSMSTGIVTERLNYSAKKPIAITTQNRVENNEVTGVTTRFEIPYIYED